ncbi:uncharacterized protein LOC122312736 [Carya illinoinensis]|uniref:uncharacterized protein LOC122312736 n=1 Tax=Carya illinoinensis TaxID=32201 RepID=UPI001C71D53A|nr:uncharacterized protein LOC122312736 [Carya illinoinensis]
MECELSSLCEGLKLTEDEQQEVVISNDEVLSSVNKSKHCIMFCVMSDREVNRGAIKSTLLRVWQVEGKAIIKDVGRNKFLLECKNVSDKRRIMKGRPWSFDKNLVCMQDCEGFNFIKEILFIKEPFWIQCYDLPFAGMNQITGSNIGSSVGDVLQVDTDSSGICWGQFLRIKVMVDVTKPLARGRFLTIGDKKHWISFKYERLPNFCYSCGRFNHSEGRCDNLDHGKVSSAGFDQQYGAWLRASTRNSVTLPVNVSGPSSPSGSSEKIRRADSGGSHCQSANNGKASTEAEIKARDKDLHIHKDGEKISDDVVGKDDGVSSLWKVNSRRFETLGAIYAEEENGGAASSPKEILSKLKAVETGPTAFTPKDTF